MPVDSTHSDYKFWLPWWNTLEDIVNGHPHVKAGGTDYLPKPSGQDARDYRDYSALATFFNATGRTLNAIIGMLFRKPVQVLNVPDLVQSRFVNIDQRGNSLESFLRMIGREVYKRGRVGVLLDTPPTALFGTIPYLTFFTANQIIDWHEAIIDGVPKLVQVRVRDRVSLPSQDRFVNESRARIRAFSLVRDNGQMFYDIEEFIANEKGQFTDQGVRQNPPPNRRRQRLDFLPFWIFGPLPGIGSQVASPPILDLAVENLAHYWATADYENARHIAGSPTLYVADDEFKNEKGKVRLGTRAMLKLSTGGQANFAALSADLIRALLEPMRERKENMAALGVQLLAPQRRAVESSETHFLRQAGETATLEDVALSLQEGMAWLLRQMTWWAGEEQARADEIQVSFPMDFVPADMDPTLFRELLAAVQSGDLSFDSFFWKISQGEVIPPGRTLEEEKELIALDSERRFQAISTEETMPLESE